MTLVEGLVEGFSWRLVEDLLEDISNVTLIDEDKAMFLLIGWNLVKTVNVINVVKT